MPSPYARQMGETIARLVAIFSAAPDSTAHDSLTSLANAPDRWSEARATRARVRDKLLKTRDPKLRAQYNFAEACLESLYNETNPDYPYDSVSPFWVVPRAIAFAETLGLPHSMVTTALRGDA